MTYGIWEGLVWYWPCITDFCVYPPAGSKPSKGRRAPYLRSCMEYGVIFVLVFTHYCSCFTWQRTALSRVHTSVMLHWIRHCAIKWVQAHLRGFFPTSLWLVFPTSVSLFTSTDYWFTNIDNLTFPNLPTFSQFFILSIPRIKWKGNVWVIPLTNKEDR